MLTMKMTRSQKRKNIAKREEFIRDFFSDWIRLLLIILIVFGVLIRIINIDKKIHYFDETFTSLRISGYTTSEVLQNFSNNEIISLEDLKKYQAPSFDKNITSTINSLALEEPQHPPLYFCLARIWTSITSPDIGALRFLSALFSIGCIPLAYCLMDRLFHSPIISLTSSAIFAISPFHLIYAQEARQYSLWFFLTLLSSIVFLQAVSDCRNKVKWLIYGLTISASLYTFSFAFFSVVSHGIYLFITEQFRLTKRFLLFLISSTLGLVSFAPWIWKIYGYSSKASSDGKTGWMFDQLSLPAQIARWVGNFSRIFLDTGYNGGGTSNIWMAFIPLTLILIIWSLTYLCIHRSQNSCIFILTLAITPFLSLVLLDFCFSTRLSTTPRYMIPSFTGIQLAVSCLLGKHIQNFKGFTGWKSWLVSATLGSVVIWGTASSLLISSQNTWWHQGPHDTLSYGTNIHRTLLREKADLLIKPFLSDVHVGDTIILSRLIYPSVDIQLSMEPDMLKIPGEKYQSIFLLAHEPEL
jgi:uncharacterized membrane protein